MTYQLLYDLYPAGTVMLQAVMKTFLLLLISQYKYSNPAIRVSLCSMGLMLLDYSVAESLVLVLFLCNSALCQNQYAAHQSKYRDNTMECFDGSSDG
uniref:Uncharacterized protein n=1 Tax=Aegilops tauschii subsp. strangulata TaxID=200361 RepID=A0A453H1Z3_AEGTS